MGDKKCASCSGPAKPGKGLSVCGSCEKYFHQTCGKLTACTLPDGTKGKACAICISQAVPIVPPTRDSSRSSRSSAASSGSTDDNAGTLKAILEKLGELGTKLDTKTEDLNRRFDAVDEKIKALDLLPAITKRVEVNEAEIEELKDQLSRLNERLDGLKQQVSQVGASSPVNPEIADQIRHLTETNAILGTRLTEMTTRQRSVSTDLVIGGLSVPSGANLRGLTVAILTTVCPELDPRDVISARLLVSRATVRTAVNNATATASNTTRSTGKSTGTRPKDRTKYSGVSNTTASTALDSSGSSTDHSNNYNMRPPSILVTLHSRQELIDVMKSKLKYGKLHTEALTPRLPEGIEPEQLSPGLININEFLPSATYKLHSLVRRKAKEPGSGFVTFIRNGQIYVRRKKGEAAVLIVTAEDLDHFLSH